MTKKRHITTETIDWQGITLSVSFERSWLGMDPASIYAIAHLQVQSIAPEGAPLPFTETGYRSHFIHPGNVDARGGPVAYVTAWLEEAAKSPEWKERQAAAKQLSLF